MSETSAARREAPASDGWFGGALFVIAFALRFGAAIWLAGEPVWDGHYYDFGARRIAEGHGYSDDRIVDGHAVWHPWCHYPVGYSGYLALFYRVLGAKVLTAHGANALAGALLAVVVFLLAREAFDGKVRARIAGGLVALHPGLVLYGAVVMSEPLSALLMFGAFFVAIRLGRSRGSYAGIVVGALVLGIAALVRPQALLCAPLLALTPGRSSEASERAPRPTKTMTWRRRTLVAILGCALALVPVLPWTARNCRVMDGCALVSTNAGWNLAIGAFPRATGRFETLRSSDGCKEVTGQVQQDRCWFNYGAWHITHAPRRWLGLVPAKLSNTFDHESFQIEYLREARPAQWPEERRVAWRRIITAFHRALVTFSAFGAIAFSFPWSGPDRRGRVVQSLLAWVLAIACAAAFAKDPPPIWPIAILAAVVPWLPFLGRPRAHPAILMSAGAVATVILTHAIFFGDDRYHVVVTPAFCLLAAAIFRAPSTGRRESEHLSPAE